MSVWCKNHFFILNIKKWQAMSFSSYNSSILYSYNIDSIEWDSITCMKDLGVLVDSKLTFNFRVDYVISKCLSMLRFIQRHSCEFTILCLYKLLFRPHLEYCLVISNPIYVSNCFRISTLETRQEMLSIIFIRDLIHGHIQYPQLLQKNWVLCTKKAFSLRPSIM